jgi:hypothetical protein
VTALGAGASVAAGVALEGREADACDIGAIDVCASELRGSAAPHAAATSAKPAIHVLPFITSQSRTADSRKRCFVLVY